MIKLIPKRFSRSSSSKLRGGAGGTAPDSEIKWEVRPGMLVQKRECIGEMVITIRVSTISKWHDISIQPTSTFGELKILLTILTNLGPEEQRLLFKGKEREDHEHLHMVGVGEKDKVLVLEDPAIKERKLIGKDKVLVLEDPAIKERKLIGSGRTQLIGSHYPTISVN